METRKSFIDLNESLLNEVLSYTTGLSDWLLLMGTCRTLRQTILHSNIWAEYPVDLCTISTCFGCGRVRLSADFVWNTVCCQTVIQFARLHLSYPDITRCIQAFSKKCSIKKLHLRIHHNRNLVSSKSDEISSMLGALTQGIENKEKVDGALVTPLTAMQSQSMMKQGRSTTSMSRANTSSSASSSSGSTSSAHAQVVPSSKNTGSAFSAPRLQLETSSSTSSVSNETSSISNDATTNTPPPQHSHGSHGSHGSNSRSSSSRSDHIVQDAAEEVLKALGRHWTESISSHSSSSQSSRHHITSQRLQNSVNNVMEEYHFDPSLPSLALESLTIFGWPSSFASTTSSSTANGFFQQIGATLVTLKLMESSPSDIFEILTNHCPHLETLIIEGFHTDMSITSHSFMGHGLKILGLHDTSLHIPPLIHVPQLQRFEYINQDDMIPTNVKMIEELIANLPTSVTELDLRIMSIHANECLVQIGQRLPHLQRLTLQLSHIGNTIPGDIYVNTLLALAKCQELTSFEMIGSCMVSIDEDAFLILPQLRKLRKLKLLYEDELIDNLPTLLSQMELLEEMIFFENAQDMQSDVDGIHQWALMEDRLQHISEMFPAIKISLVDCWWT